MYKNLKAPAVECLENGNYHMYRKPFPAKTTFFKMDPSARKLQESGNNKKNLRKLNELSNYVH